MGPEVEFNMLTFIMFDYMYDSGHGNNFEHHKRYRELCARTKKREVKNEDFGLYFKYKKMEERRNMPGVG